MKIAKLIIVLSVLFWGGSCANTSTTVVNQEKPFFDLNAFFEKEIATQKITSIKKTVQINSEAETKTLTDFDLKTELKFFMDCDINKPALFDKYITARFPNKIIHTALYASLKVQKIEIAQAADETVQSITIFKQADTAIYSTDKVLIYTPKVGFSIKNDQKTLLTDGKRYDIKVVF